MCPTRRISVFQITSLAGASGGDERNPMLVRVYGTAFPRPKRQKLPRQAQEAKRRDHRKLGGVDLFRFNRGSGSHSSIRRVVAT